LQEQQQVKQGATMAVFDIFSRRQQRSQGKSPDVFQYDDIPLELRVQILHAMDDAVQRIYERTIPGYRVLGTEGTDCFAEACRVLRRELGTGRLSEDRRRSRPLNESQTTRLRVEFADFFQDCDTEHVLDAIEVVMYFIEDADRHHVLDHECNSRTVAAEINTRFLQHGVGYQYESGQIIVQTNSVLHAEAVKPALHLLADPAFQGANEEFLKAHDHYRHQRYSECLVDCLKTFESIMKIICDRKRWAYNQTDTASKLIDVCLSNGLVPTFTQQQLTSLRTLLESGVPTIRNKQAGHGQGTQQHDVPSHLARFALHATAAVIVLLVEAYQDTL
jgi:hypothetical protein